MIFIMLSVLLFSYNNVLWKKNIKATSIPFLVAYRAFFTSTISIGFLLLFFTIEHISISDFIKITTGSLFGVLGLFSMLAVIKKSSLQWLGIYNLLGVVFTILYLKSFFISSLKKFKDTFPKLNELNGASKFNSCILFNFFLEFCKRFIVDIYAPLSRQPYLIANIFPSIKLPSFSPEVSFFKNSFDSTVGVTIY